jgi:drug/metabolite transporter (DMT)-like permease
MMVCLAFAVILVPLSMATILGKTTPLWDLLLLWVLLGLRPVFTEILLVPVAFIGLLLILIPGGQLSIATISYLGLMLGLSSGMFNCLELITLRWLRRTDSTHTINLWYASITIILTLPFVLGSPWPDQPMIWFYAVMFGLFSFAGQTLQAEAMQTITPTVASVSTLLVPAFATLIGWVVFGQLLSGLELVGITVVLTAGALVQLRESRQRDALATAKFRWQR